MRTEERVAGERVRESEGTRNCANDLNHHAVRGTVAVDVARVQL